MEDTSKPLTVLVLGTWERLWQAEVREAGPQHRWAGPSEPLLSPVLREGICSTGFRCAVFMTFNFIL